ncbi:MAG: ATP synthase F1 subunit gamma [Candidatus Omnitrophota bacterium]
MTESLRNIKLRIRSVGNTQKITRAMEMVSAVKLGRVKAALYASRPYVVKLESLMDRLAASVEIPSHPLLKKREEVRTIALSVITSDAGLCSTYNYAVIRAADDFVKRFHPGKVKIAPIGREGGKHFRQYGIPLLGGCPEPHGRCSAEIPEKIASYLTGSFSDGNADEVYVAYMHFDSTLRHRPVVEKYLPVESKKAGAVNYIVEPDIARVMDELVPHYLAEKMRLVLLNAFTSEHSARMVAMKTATDNAEEMIDGLTLLRNKVRQATITKEVIEIASSAEALKG